ncbi:MAG: hypothetical protein Q4C25_03530, partial [Bacillota bacterium]|nr:hypothetical protein [Bacillota bacterium]
ALLANMQAGLEELYGEYDYNDSEIFMNIEKDTIWTTTGGTSIKPFEWIAKNGYGNKLDEFIYGNSEAVNQIRLVFSIDGNGILTVYSAIYHTGGYSYLVYSNGNKYQINGNIVDNNYWFTEDLLIKTYGNKAIPLR